MALAPKEEYQDPTPLPAPSHPERRGVSRRRVIAAAKEAVQVTDLAERLSGPGVRRGREVAFRCPLHDDHNPSMRVDPDKGLWFCDPCGVGGDVVDLAASAWGYGRGEMAMAAADLLREFGHPIPERPRSWHAKQKRQKPVRDGMEAALILTARRRLYRRFFEPIIAATVDPEDRAHDEQELWEATLPLAEHLVGQMMRRAR